MLHENQKAGIDYLKEVILGLKTGLLEIDELIQDKDYIEHHCEDGKGGQIVEGRFLTGSGTIKLHYRQVPKKEPKSQSEIFKELYESEYLLMFDALGKYLSPSEHDMATRKATKFAVENTVKVWKEQYVS